MGIILGVRGVNALHDLINTEHKSGKLTPAILLGLLILFLISRFVYLDRDLPSSVICSYIAIDELYYTEPAFNLYHYGETIHNIVPFVQERLEPRNILENIMTFFPLSFLGNNYYGLRSASVLAALIIFILLFLILRKIINNNIRGENGQELKTRSYLLYFIMAYLLCDFSFLMAGRVAEPTIFRMLAMVILIYIASLPFLAGNLECSRYSLFLGFLSFAAVVFVYIYNTFVFCAFALSVFIWAYKSGLKNAVKQLIFFLIGSALCFLVYQWFINAVYHCSILEAYQFLIPYQNRMGLGAGPADRIGSYLVNIIFLFLTNIFRFNIIFLFIFLLSLPIFIRKIKAEYNNFDILIFNLVLFLILQSIVINDYPLRKLIILFPLAVIVITTGYTYFTEHREEFIHTGPGRQFINRSGVAAGIISLLVTALYLSPRLAGESISVVGDFMYLNCGIFIAISITLLVAYLSAAYIPKAVIISCMILMLLPSIYLDGKYVYFNRTYYFRDAMIAMGESVNGQITAGGCSFGFRLYNESIPVLDFYSTKNSTEKRLLFDNNFDRIFAEGIGTCSIAYTDDNPDAPVGSDYMDQHGLKLAEKFELGEFVNTDVGIYIPK